MLHFLAAVGDEPVNGRLLTVGYGSRTRDELFDILRRNDVQFLLDVRSSPYSKFNSSFSQGELEKACQLDGFKYVFLGDQLGGRPLDSRCYVAGKVDYAYYATTEPFRAGVRRVAAAWLRGLHVALMCSEQKPELCHRAKLIGSVLDGMDVPIIHIDEKGNCLDQASVMRRLLPEQISVFNEERALFSRKRYRP